jgi:hypothetical protein
LATENILSDRDEAVNPANDQAAMGNARPCPVCRQPIGKTHSYSLSLLIVDKSLLDKKHIYKASAFEPTSEELEEMQKSVRSRGSTSDSDDDDNILDIFTIKSKGKDKEKVKVEPEVPHPNKLDLDENWEPSTKMIRMVGYYDPSFSLSAS